MRTWLAVFAIVALAGCAAQSEVENDGKRTIDPYFVGIWKGDKRQFSPSDPKPGEKNHEPKSVDTTVEVRADGTATMLQTMTDVPFEGGVTMPFLTIKVDASWVIYSNNLVFMPTHVDVEGQATGKALEQFKRLKPEIERGSRQQAFFAVKKVDDNTFEMRDSQPGYVSMHRSAKG